MSSTRDSELESQPPNPSGDDAADTCVSTDSESSHWISKGFDLFIEHAVKALEEQNEASNRSCAMWPDSSGAKRLGSMAEATALKSLGQAMVSERSTATFACGGSCNIPPAVTVRWGPLSGHGGVVRFPASQDDESFQHLLRHCQPATFEYGEEKKLLELDKAEFDTDFSPHNRGIIDAIERVIVPGTLPSGNNGPARLSYLRIKAELVKMKVKDVRKVHIVLWLTYSKVYSVAGKFNAEVDTPLRRDYFGSLVVCLPSSHTGM